MGRQFAHAIDRSGVQALGAVGLGLQADADVFDGAGDDGVGDAGEGAGEVVLGVGEGGVGGAGGAVGLFELAAGVVEGAELDGYAGADADEGG